MNTLSLRTGRARPTPRCAAAVSVAVVVALTAAGCADAGPPATDEPRDAGAATKPPVPELTPFYEQRLAWSSCGDDAECADVHVPLDYDHPDGERITIAVKRITTGDDSADARSGSLLVNFGGPGASGVDLVEGFAAQLGDSPLLDAYDVVGFDPRGVGSSAAVDCVDDAGMDALRAATVDRLSPAGLERFTADATELAAACAERTGPLLGEVDTVSAARDLDVLRAVLGDDRLSYLGFSYGTFLGATYADLFPARAGRLVLDGAVDPTLTYADMVAEQAAGFERSLRVYVEACLQGPDCPLSGGVDDAVGQVQALLRRTVTEPLRTADGRPLTSGVAATGILITLYDHHLWPVLTGALDRAFTAGDGSELLMLADFIAGRQPDGTYLGNTAEAQGAITCLDHSMDSSPEDMAEAAGELVTISPTFAQFMVYDEIRCQAWPHEATGRRGPITAEGAPPILVVGTTGDPATPYAWSQALADQLESGHLLTWEGEGHTAYGRSGECVRDAVDAFLVEGTLPPEGQRC